MKKARLIDGKLVLKFTGGDFRQTLNNIKSLPASDRKYSPASKDWIVTNTRPIVEQLLDWGFELPNEVVVELLPDKDEAYKTEVLDNPLEALRDYQVDALKFLQHHNGRGLLAMDMGSGKTISSLAYLALKEEHYPALIVAPAPTKPGWSGQYRKFFDKDKRIKEVYGVSDVGFYDGAYDIVIINYELLSLHVTKTKKSYAVNGEIKQRDTFEISEELKQFFSNDFQFVIIDEIQNMANEKSNLYHALKAVGRTTPHLVGLSGTPFNNRPRELFNFLNLCRPDLFSNRYAYYNRYCGPEEVRVGHKVFKKYDGLSNAVELNRLLENEVMYRVTVDQALSLPKKNVIAVPTEMDNPQEYFDLEAKIVEEIKDVNNRRIAMERFEIMKQEAYKQKKNNCFDFIKLKLQTVDKIVIFTTHTEVVEDVLAKFGKKALRYDGKITTKQKEENKAKFISDKKVNILVANIKAGGTGVDGLQDIANVMVFLELPWTKTLLDQAIARLHRSGQDQKVTAYLMVAEGSIDEEIAQIIDNKADMSSRVIDGKDVEESDLIQKLLEKYGKGID